MYIVRWKGETLVLCSHKHKTEEAKNRCLQKTYNKLQQLEAVKKANEEKSQKETENVA